MAAGSPITVSLSKHIATVTHTASFVSMSNISKMTHSWTARTTRVARKPILVVLVFFPRTSSLIYHPSNMI